MDYYPHTQEVYVSVLKCRDTVLEAQVRPSVLYIRIDHSLCFNLRAKVRHLYLCYWIDKRTFKRGKSGGGPCKATE